MASKCNDITIDNSNAVTAEEIAYEANVDSTIQDIIGYEQEVISNFDPNTKLGATARKAYYSLYNSLKKHLMDNGREIGYSLYNPKSRMEDVLDFVQSQLKTQAIMHSSYSNAVNERRMIAASKLIRNWLNIANSRHGQKLNVLERAFMPVSAFALKNDKFGHIYKYIKKLTTILEESRRRSAKYKSAYNDINTTLMSSIKNAIKTNTGPIDYSWTMVNEKKSVDDILNSGEGLHGLKTNDGRDVIFLGSTSKGHDVIYLDTAERTFAPVASIPREDIENSLLNKYTYELMNDLMHGQTRLIKWHDEIPKEDLDKVKTVLNSVKYMREKFPEEYKKGISDMYTFHLNGYTYYYTMVKGQGTYGEEVYNAYILGHREDTEGAESVFYLNKESKGDRHKIKDLSAVTKDGFYRANEYATFGKRIVKGEKTKSSVRGWDFRNTENLYLRNQPNKIIMGLQPDVARTFGASPAEKRIRYSSIWSALSDMRAMYNSIGTDVYFMANREEELLNKFFVKNSNGVLLLKDTLSRVLNNADDVNQFALVLENMFNINKRFWAGKDGKIHTPNGSFSKIGDNYAPIIYADDVVDIMLERQIEDMENRLAGLPEDTEEYGQLYEQIDHFKLTMARRTDDTNLIEQMESKLDVQSNEATATISERTVYTKHREEWTDPALRRKDPNVHNNYLDNVFYSLEKNAVMLDLLNVIDKMGNSGISKGTMDWMINRTKIAFADPSAWGGIGDLDYSYKTLAKWLNKLPLGVKFDERSAMKLMNWTKGLLSGALLGATGAMTNRTQIVNEIISSGLKYERTASAILKNKGNDLAKWEAIIDNAGTDEISNMFMDVMASGGDLSLQDAGLINPVVLPIQIPTKTLIDYFKIKGGTRSKFISNGIPEIDKYLNRQEIARVRKVTNQIARIQQKEKELLSALSKIKDKQAIRNTKAKIEQYKREERRLSSESERRNVRALRENYIDLLMTPKSQNNSKLLEAKFKKITGDVSETRLRRMIAWKLSWWWDSLAPELFTFTEGERYMRKESVIIALLMADEQGMLGSESSKRRIRVPGQDDYVEIEERFLSDNAVRIARNAVSNTMFGMSPIHLGEAFVGAGAHLGLYKAYPLQQMMHDHKILQSFSAGNLNTVDGVSRLAKTAYDMAVMAKNGKKYSPTLENFDHEAATVLRFVATRMAMSIFAIGLESIRMFRVFTRNPIMNTMSSMIRGGENPAMAIAFRTLVNFALFAMADDDEFEGDFGEIIWDIARLFFPVFLTLPIATGESLYRQFN